ncbi:hypothetical protein G6F22_018738 [Rhizopus arrhizus]|nr:hypothetical protein G6F22_018738 [Rhizopus arrhizus]
MRATCASRGSRCCSRPPAAQGCGAPAGAGAADRDAGLHAVEEGLRCAAPAAGDRPPRAGDRAGDRCGDRFLRWILRAGHRQFPDLPVRALLRAGFPACIRRVEGGEPGDQCGGNLVLRAHRQHPVAVRAADGGGQHHRLGGRHAIGAEGRHAVHPQAVRGVGGGADRTDGVGYVPRCVNAVARHPPPRTTGGWITA